MPHADRGRRACGAEEIGPDRTAGRTRPKARSRDQTARCTRDRTARPQATADGPAPALVCPPGGRAGSALRGAHAPPPYTDVQTHNPVFPTLTNTYPVLYKTKHNVYSTLQCLTP